jgi:regulator of sirC expression with transglutaminase-like and TPR domain
MQPPSPNYCNQEAFEQFLECTRNLETNESLLGGAIAISRHFLDGARCESVPWSIAALADSVLERVSSRAPEALMAHLHDVLFDVNGFEGNSQNYYDIENSLLPTVIETRLGLPISLTLIYKLVAEEVGLRVEGVNSPGHFLARVHLSSRESMLVDSFHSGRILTVRESVELITGTPSDDAVTINQCLPTCTHRQWLARILNNLQSVLLSQSRFDDVSAMRELLVALLEP